VIVVRTDVSEELIASIIKVKRISEIGTADMFLRKVGSYKSHTASHLRRRHIYIQI
jgi:hypothetical protein